MQGFISSFIILLIALQTSGRLLVFKLQQYHIRAQVKQQIKAGVPEDELVLLKIPAALEQGHNRVFQRIHAREFRYHGQMYDIVRQQSRGDTTWYYCVSDEQETLLFARLDELVQQNMTGTQPHNSQIEMLLRLLGALYFYDGIQQLEISRDAAAQLAALFQFRVKTWKAHPATPPPEQAA